MTTPKQKIIAGLLAVFTLFNCARADVFWQMHNPLPKAGTLDQMQIDDQGRMVALYNNGLGLATSMNGTNWAWERTANPLRVITSIAYGNGKWVAINVSSNNIYYTLAQASTDLKNWTQAEIATPSFISGMARMTFGGGKFWLVSVGNDSAIPANFYPVATYTSEDGQNWTLVPDSNLPVWQLNTLAYDETNHLLIAGGKIGNVSDYRGVLVTSPDGANWTIRYTQSETNSQLNHIRCADGVDLACGAAPYPAFTATNLYRSTDGINWTTVTVPNDSSGYHYLASYLTNWICWDTSFGAYILSTNSGLTWSARSTGYGSPNNPITGVYRTNDGRWYAGGGNGTVVYTTNANSLNTWSNVPAGTKGDFKGLAVGADGRMVAVSSDGSIYSSPEGTNWQNVATGSSSYYGVWNFTGTYMAISTTARLWLSTNGTSFTNYAMNQSVVGMMYDGNKIIGWRNSNGTNFFTTTTGTNWTIITNSVVPGTRAGRLLKFDAQYLYIENNGVPGIYASSDLVNWSSNGLANLSNLYFNNLDYDVFKWNGNYVHIGTGVLLKSPDGIHWTNITMNSGWQPGDGRACLIGNRLYTISGNNLSYGHLIYSDTGTNWNTVDEVPDVWPTSAVLNNFLYYTGSRLVAVGKTGLIASLTTPLDGGTMSSQDFAAWKQQYTFPPDQSGEADDADGDGVKNIFEYYFGSNPTNAASGAQPAEITVNVSGQNYPAITFIRSRNVSGVTLLPQVSSTVNFTDSLGYTVQSVVDLGNGTEQVTIRSNISMAGQTAQFLRIQLSVP